MDFFYQQTASPKRDFQRLLQTLNGAATVTQPPPSRVSSGLRDNADLMASVSSNAWAADILPLSPQINSSSLGGELNFGTEGFTVYADLAFLCVDGGLTLPGVSGSLNSGAAAPGQLAAFRAFVLASAYPGDANNDTLSALVEWVVANGTLP